MRYTTIKWEIHPNPSRPEEESIGLLAFNRPERMNAVNPKMILELDALLNEIRRDCSVKVVILTGEGRNFCSGGDVYEEGAVLGATEIASGLQGPFKEMAEWFFNDLSHVIARRIFKKLEDLPQITIAAINGWVAGTGVEMCLLCDYRMAADDARLMEVAVSHGFMMEAGGMRNLPKMIGRGRALEMILDPQPVEAEDALRIGLVDRVVPAKSLREEAFAFAGRIASKPWLSVLEAKAQINMYWTADRTEERWNRELDAILEICRTEDCTEGVRAFFEKREPHFRGPRYPDYFRHKEPRPGS